MAMRFWGVEVKGNEPCKVSSEDGYIIHVSQATLGAIKKDKENVIVHVKVDGKKLVMGMLSQETPQLSCDLVFDGDFEISHNWKNGSIHLIGYEAQSGEPMLEFESSDEEEEEEDVPVPKENGQAAAPAIKAPAAKPKVENKPKPELKVDEDDESDSEDDDFDGESDSEQGMGMSDSGDDDDDSEDSEDEKPANVPDASKKRPNADIKTPQAKKAKIATPEKTDSKKKGVVHPATPYPKKGEKSQKTPAGDKTDSKKGGNTPAGDKTPKSGGSVVSCNSCKKTFKSDSALESHSKAKHSAK